MKKFFAVLKSILTWFMLLTYPIMLLLLIPLFWMSVLFALSPSFPM